MAAGRQVPRPADLFRQQDGPHRRELQAHLRSDHLQAGGQSGRHPAADRRRGQVRRRGRPDPDEVDHLQGRDAGRRLRCRRHPGRHAGGGEALPRAADREGQRGRRQDPREVPPRRRHLRRRNQGRAAQAREQLRPRSKGEARVRAGDLRIGVQEQGRPAAARRGRRLPAVAGRRAGDRRDRSDQEGRDPDRAARDRRRAVCRTGVQDHDRPVRRPADLHPRLLGRADVWRDRLQRHQAAQRADRPPPEDARQQA